MRLQQRTVHAQLHDRGSSLLWGRVTYLALYAAGVSLLRPSYVRGGGAENHLGPPVAGLNHDS